MSQLHTVSPIAQEPACQADPVTTEDFLRLLVHELRQPLSTIESAAYLLEMMSGAAQRQPEHSSETLLTEEVKRIQQMVEEMGTILQDVIAMNPGPTRVEPVCLHSLVSDVLGDLEPDGSGEILAPPPESDCGVMMDPVQARQMVSCLLRATRQLSGEERASVVVESDEEWVQMRVHAAVCGVGTDMLLTPFAPQLPRHLGLALPAVKQIAERHGGSVTAECNPQLRFCVTLPALPPE